MQIVDDVVDVVVGAPIQTRRCGAPCEVQKNSFYVESCGNTMPPFFSKTNDEYRVLYHDARFLGCKNSYSMWINYLYLN